MPDRSAEIVAAAETVASWARARRAALNAAALAAESESSDTLSGAAAPEPEAEDERQMSVSEMLTSLVMNAEFRNNPDQ